MITEIVPSDFLMFQHFKHQISQSISISYRYKKECSVAFRICQNEFMAMALPRTPLVELTTLPRPPSQLGREGILLLCLTFGARHASSVPQNSSQIYAYVQKI